MRFSRTAALVVVGVLVVAGLGAVVRSGDKHHLTATFPSTISLYKGAKVKVLGVPVGSVDKIEVKGASVQVEISYDDDVRLPADVHAVVVPPSIVGDRFVQLTPAYESGAVLKDDASLGLDRTAVPLELDDVYRSLDEVAVAFGPQGANKDGALSRLVTASANNLRGNGRLLNQTIQELTAAISTIASSRENISGTIGNVGKVTNTLAGNDEEMRALVSNLAHVSAELNGQRGDIANAVTGLRGALKIVTEFVKNNREAFKKNVDNLTSVSTTLERHTDELSQLVEIAPVGLLNLMNIYIPRNWDMNNRGASNPNGRVGSRGLHGPLTSDLDTQLSYTLGIICASLPVAQAEQLSAVCSAVQQAGGILGALLSKGATGGVFDLAPGADTLGQLLGGTR